MKDSLKNNKVLILLFVGVLMSALDISVVGPAIPAIGKTIPLGGTDISWIFSVYLLFYLFGIPILSKLSDINGRRSIYIMSLFLFAIGSGLVSISDDLTFLLTGRAIQGFGASGIFPVAAATIGDVYPLEKRGRALGMLGGVFGIAFIIGPILAGTILHYSVWNTIFLINLPLALILIGFAFFWLPEKPQGEKSAFNLKGILMLVVVLSSFSLGLNNLDAKHPLESLFSWPALPFLLTVLIVLPLLIRHERTQTNPFISIGLFASKQLRLVGIIAFGLGLFQSSIVFIPKLAVQLFGVSPSKASFMLIPLVLATAIVPPVSGRLLEVIGSRMIIFTGLVIVVVSLVLFSFLSENSTIFYAASGCLGFGLAIRASLKFALLNETGPKERASALGMLMILIAVGELTGAALIGVIISGSASSSDGFGYAFLLLASTTAILVVLSFFLKKRKRELLKNLS
jgi:EmrB/QacA subfamily drug resistance transporter